MAVFTKKKSKSYKKYKTRRNGGEHKYTVHNNAMKSQKNVSVNKKNVNYVLTNTVGRQIIIPIRNIIKLDPYFKETGVEETMGKMLFQNLIEKMKCVTIYDLQKKIETAITSQYTFKYPCKKVRTWEQCTGECSKIIKELVAIELQSTAYMLRTISKSILWANKKKGDPPPIKFRVDNALNGIWENDKDSIKIEGISGKSTIAFEEMNKTNRLIMGFGPSAAGKTYWAQTLINLFSSATDDFPKVFLSIDGGLYRETSMIYQMVVNTLSRTCIAGFSNLVVIDLTTKFLQGIKYIDSLFNADIIKKQMSAFIQQYTGNISLYVPETLGGCGLGVTQGCKKQYQPYIDITGDTQWIGLLIWQHKLGSKCDKPDNYKCKGCTESGEERQITEGKLYSSMAYDNSMYKGWKHMTGLRTKPPINDISKDYEKEVIKDNSSKNKDDTIIKGAPGGKFMIHNTGGRKTANTMNRTTIVDSTDKEGELSKTLRISDNQNKFMYSYIKDTAK